MRKSFCRWLLSLLGWKLGPSGENVPKCVVCLAPHTSNFDFLVGQLFSAAVGRQANFLIKKEWFFPPLGFLFKIMGGIPVNRRKNMSRTEQLAGEFKRRKSFWLVVTPEGTRRRVNEWKRGFYYIALKAQVPIQMAYIDYGRKELGIGNLFYPTGNADADIQTIRSYYRGMRGRHRDRFGEL
ncbi:MAG: lysophospholipid acyltransferase family protein [Tannerella sp.]|jgi:1-acyl-sn-glycerol-3-phosphate acyltransferase|nr:lysophospholipid acyltransferase family protein [Tannerella sp.]